MILTVTDTLQTIPETFWQQVNKTEGCWLWTGSLTEKGYGKVTYKRRTYRAHRLIYEKLVGPIPTGYFICHTCDVPNCVNPNHLWIGTHKENMRDMCIKGRAATGERNGRHRSKLNDFNCN